MQSKSFEPMRSDNPFFGQTQKAGWARLVRVGGDRVSILLDHLRKRVGVIEGLAEEVTFDGEGKGAAAAYSVADRPMFTAHVAAGALEISVRLDGRERDALLASKKLGAAMRRMLETARVEAGHCAIRFAVRTPADVGSIAKLIVLRSRMAPNE